MKINSKVFYPKHGAATIVDEKELDFAGEKRMYFEFKLIGSTITLSAPQDMVEKLGIRKVNEPETLMKILKTLKAKPSLEPETQDHNAFINLLKELEERGEPESFIKIIQYCNYMRNQRHNDNKVVPTSINKYIKSSMQQLIAELSLAKDIPYDKAESSFTDATGIVA